MPPAAVERSIETRTSWVVAIAAVAILATAHGAPLMLVVSLKPIAEDLGVPRSLPSLASSLTHLGSGLGGVLMGWAAGRIGMRAVALLGGAMLAAGLALAAGGTAWKLLAAYAVPIGFFGIGALFAPLVTHVSMWFDRRRGTALALVSSGQYLASMVWPPIFERLVSAWGWQRAMLGFAGFAAAAILPLAALVLRRPPAAPLPGTMAAGPAPGTPVLGLPPNLAFVLLGAASFLCCVPMAMPAAHLVAFCSDLGIAASHGAAMLSVLFAAAFLSRQAWGWISDRIGGLHTVLAGSAAQAVAMTAFMVTQDEAGLFLISALYGLGFAGIIPAYVLTVRDLFPASEASWRVPTLLFMSLGGMAAGAWLAGALYDRFGTYEMAFAAGIAFNLANLALVLFLAFRQQGVGRPRWA